MRNKPSRTPQNPPHPEPPPHRPREPSCCRKHPDVAVIPDVPVPDLSRHASYVLLQQHSLHICAGQMFFTLSGKSQLCWRAAAPWASHDRAGQQEPRDPAPGGGSAWLCVPAQRLAAASRRGSASKVQASLASALTTTLAAPVQRSDAIFFSNKEKSRY